MIDSNFQKSRFLFFFLIGHTVSPYPSDQLSERSQVSTTALQCSEDAIKAKNVTHFNE